MILLGTITYYLSTQISEPIQKLSDAANKISEGDFGVRTGITSHDEIGYLSSSFDFMAQRLQDSLIEIKGQKNVILQQEGILLQFFNHSKRYCVGIVDIVNSTKISANLSGFEISEFYIIFLNSLASIIKNFDGTVVKNLGDGLLFYFTLDDINKRIRLQQCLDCCLALGKAQGTIAEKLKKQHLPPFDYRISATCGDVRVATTSTSSINDIFGMPVNRCAKINRSAPPNGLVIGQELYDAVKTLDGFRFEKIENKTITLEYGYNVYAVSQA